MNHIPFRQMRPTLKLIQAQSQLLLAVPGIEWPQNDYALFFAMADISKRMENPTRFQMVTQIAVWLRFCNRLIDSLPEDNPLRVDARTEFDKLSKPYKDVLK
jgi:hypothetical protein